VANVATGSDVKPGRENAAGSQHSAHAKAKAAQLLLTLRTVTPISGEAASSHALLA